MRLIPAAQQVRMPWKNGGGVTTEVARAPAEGEFAWRISIADVATGGPFSAFPRIDRVIIRIGEGALDLTVDGVAQPLERYVPFAFDGEAETSATVPDGPTRDLNVMTVRGRASAEVSVRQLEGIDRITPAGGAQLAVIVLEGLVEVSAGEQTAELGEHDAVIAGGEPVVLESGRAIVVLAELGLSA